MTSKQRIIYFIVILILVPLIGIFLYNNQGSQTFISDSSTTITVYNNQSQNSREPLLTDTWMDNLLYDLSRLKFFNAPMPEQYPGCKIVTLVFPDGNHVRTCVEISK